MRILIIGKIWPEPRSSAAGIRTMDLIKAVQDAAWDCHFASAAQASEFTVSPEELGPLQLHQIALNDSSFDRWIHELAPDLVVFDRYMTEEQFGWRVAKSCPDALRVVDTSDLHFLREARRQQLSSNGSLQLRNSVALREIASIFRSDLSLIISEFEVELLREEFSIPEYLIAYWPFCLPTPSDASPSFSERQDFVMIGSFLHEPNWDAVRWCKEQIWPLIRKELTAASLHVYGSYTPSKASQLHDPKSGFLIKGRAENAISTLEKYRVNLAPLRFGAGLKGKLADAFLAGLPTVATPIAVEGMTGDLPWGSDVSDDPLRFSETAIRLYRDENFWSEAKSCGRQIATQRFPSNRWLKELPRILAEALRNRDRNRSQNFIGEMLNFHHHRSTEFMSRWIEEKNANR